MINLEMIKQVTDAFGPPGFEEEVVAAVSQYLPGFRLEEDPMHNLYAHHPKNTGNRFTVQLDAHLDEVGFMVQSINRNGTLTFVPTGGWVATNVPAHTVWVRNSAGKKYRGIIASKPPHFMSAKEKANPTVEIESLVIDLGASSREEVIRDFGIATGDQVAPEVHFEYYQESDVLFGKAFDNRLGCLSIIETLNRLKDVDLGFDLVGAFASQEEVGMRGAAVTAQVVRPDAAIVFEGSPSDDLYYDEYTAQCALKKGTQIRLFDASYVSHRGLVNLARELGDKGNIPYQTAVRRAGSTDAGKIHLTGKAVPCLVLGIPSRFIHTHYNHAALQDLESTVQMAVSVLKNLRDFKF